MMFPHPKSPGLVLFDDNKPEVDRRCPMLVKISKNMPNGRMQTLPQKQHDCPCICPHPILGPTKNYSLDYEVEFPRFGSNAECDEVAQTMLLDGCYMVIKGEMKLKDAECPPHSHTHGTHEDWELYLGCQSGEWEMFRPVDPGDPTQGFVLVFEGELHGTIGFDPQPCPENEHPRCCQENHTRGMLIGKGVGLMRDCTFCATYDGRLNSLDDADLCRKNDIGWSIWLDGVVCCPCPEHDEMKKQKKG